MLRRVGLRALLVLLRRRLRQYMLLTRRPRLLLTSGLPFATTLFLWPTSPAALRPHARAVRATTPFPVLARSVFLPAVLQPPLLPPAAAQPDMVSILCALCARGVDTSQPLLLPWVAAGVGALAGAGERARPAEQVG